MAHAQTSTITVAQLPVTLAHNRLLAEKGEVAANNQNPDKVVNQDDVFKATAKVCITCHSPVGARFAANPDALYPFDNADTLRRSDRSSRTSYRAADGRGRRGRRATSTTARPPGPSPRQGRPGPGRRPVIAVR